jgi:spore coat polysaccharide biosynthesis protein SpsF (cytidylyltransferase family)
MTLSKETIEKIKADAKEKYPAMYPGNEHQKNVERYRIGYEAGATEWAGKAQQKLIDLLDEARLQIEYLHKKFGETGSGNNVLARIETELAKYKEVGNG